MARLPTVLTQGNLGSGPVVNPSVPQGAFGDYRGASSIGAGITDAGQVAAQAHMQRQQIRLAEYKRKEAEAKQSQNEADRIAAFGNISNEVSKYTVERADAIITPAMIDEVDAFGEELMKKYGNNPDIRNDVARVVGEATNQTKHNFRVRQHEQQQARAFATTNSAIADKITGASNALGSSENPDEIAEALISGPEDMNSVDFLIAVSDATHVTPEVREEIRRVTSMRMLELAQDSRLGFGVRERVLEWATDNSSSPDVFRSAESVRQLLLRQKAEFSQASVGRVSDYIKRLDQSIRETGPDSETTRQFRQIVDAGMALVSSDQRDNLQRAREASEFTGSAIYNIFQSPAMVGQPQEVVEFGARSWLRNEGNIASPYYAQAENEIRTKLDTYARTFRNNPIDVIKTRPEHATTHTWLVASLASPDRLLDETFLTQTYELFAKMDKDAMASGAGVVDGLRYSTEASQAMVNAIKLWKANNDTTALTEFVKKTKMVTNALRAKGTPIDSRRALSAICEAIDDRVLAGAIYNESAVAGDARSTHDFFAAVLTPSTGKVTDATGESYTLDNVIQATNMKLVDYSNSAKLYGSAREVRLIESESAAVAQYAFFLMRSKGLPMEEAVQTAYRERVDNLYIISKSSRVSTIPTMRMRNNRGMLEISGRPDAFHSDSEVIDYYEEYLEQSIGAPQAAFNSPFDYMDQAARSKTVILGGSFAYGATAVKGFLEMAATPGEQDFFAGFLPFRDNRAPTSTFLAENGKQLNWNDVVLKDVDPQFILDSTARFLAEHPELKPSESDDKITARQLYETLSDLGQIRGEVESVFKGEQAILLAIRRADAAKLIEAIVRENYKASSSEAKNGLVLNVVVPASSSSMPEYAGQKTAVPVYYRDGNELKQVFYSFEELNNYAEKRRHYVLRALGQSYKDSLEMQERSRQVLEEAGQVMIPYTGFR